MEKINPSSDFRYLDQARNCVFARVLSCIQKERIASGFFYSNSHLPPEISSKSLLNNWGFISKPREIEGNPQLEVETPGFWFPLDGMPVLFKVREHSESYRKILLLDNRDIGFPILFNSGGKLGDNLSILSKLYTLTNQLKVWLDEPGPYYDRIVLELESCIEHQAVALETAQEVHPQMLDDDICWEQSLIVGNPMHPMHKTRFGFPPIGAISPGTNLMNPTIHFFAVPRSKALLSGDFGVILKPIFDRVQFDSIREIIVPVHEIQVPLILEKFPFARHLSHTEPAQAQASIRTVRLNSLPQFNIKLSLEIFISSALRNISPAGARFGLLLKPILERIIEDNELLKVAQDIGSVSVDHPDETFEREMVCVVREDPASLVKSNGEKVLLCAALTECYKDQYVVNSLFNLYTKQDRVNFLDHFLNLFVRAFVPPIFKFGFTFEADGQNTLARFKFNESRSNWELVGFIIRDMNGIDFNLEAVTLGTGLEELKNNPPFCLSEHAGELELVYQSAFNSLFYQNIHSFIRALDLHYCGTGWRILRMKLDKIIPAKCRLREVWLESPTVFVSSSLKKKLQGKIQEYSAEIPNLLLYEPENNI